MKHLFWPRTKNIRPCLVYFFSSLNFRHLSLITQNTLPVWQNHSLVITQYFSYYLWVPYLSHCAGFFFFFSFSITEPSEKKKKEPNCQPGEEREKKKESKVVKRWGWYCLWVPYVCLITILSLSYELWKLKTAKMCF